MGYDVSSWGPIIVYHNIKLLDEESLKIFEQNEMPSLDVYLRFLDHRYKTLERKQKPTLASTNIQGTNNTSTSKSVKANIAQKSKDSKKLAPCMNCKENHKIYTCPQFTAWTQEQRNTLKKEQ